MKNLKPQVTPEKIQRLLAQYFEEPVYELEAVPGGEVAQTLSFQVRDQGYILRLNPLALEAGFKKEAFIYHHFASPALPIPPIIALGRQEDWVYAISRRISGRGLMSVSPQEYGEMLPELIRTLHAIHTSDVDRWAGFGPFDERGQGTAESWRQGLTEIMAEESPESYFGSWHTLFTTTFLERGYYERVYEFMLGLLDFCPEERFLVHGDFGYNNVLAHQGRITAVLDWVNAQYGDFVYDIAWLDFWGRGVNFPDLIRQFYTAQGMPLPHYEKRLSCYQAYIGLNAMRFYAKTQNQGAYGYTRQVLEDLLKQRL